MKTAFKSVSFIILIVIIILPCWPLMAYDKETQVKGTLILATTCKDGVIMCSDTRMTYGLNKHEYFDEFQKLRPINKRGLYAVSGISFFVDENDPSPIVAKRKIFDVNRIVDNFFINHNSGNIEQDIQLLKSSLISESFRYFSLNKNVATTLIDKNYTDNSLYRILLFVISGINSFSGYDLQAFIQPNNGSISINVKTQKLPMEFFSEVRLRCYGHPEVPDEIFLGHDSRFDDARIDPDVIVFSSRLSKPTTELSKHETVEFMKRLIRISSDLAPILGSEPSIGPGCDCAILSLKNGFEWLEKSSYSK